MRPYLVVLFWGSLAQASEDSKSIDESINAFFEPIAAWAFKLIFFPIYKSEVIEIPFVLALLVFSALFFTIYFKFINFRAFGLALRTLQGRYSSEQDPGQISHFQALTTALSATVGLGNIAGVAVAIGLGGPGATFWMILMGLLGMSSKFCESTLSVKYREFTKDQKVIGGGMQYLKQGLKEKGLKSLGQVLAIVFAIGAIGGSIGAGNMFQANQAYAQISETFEIFEEAWQFGILLSVIVGGVIIGGIRSIAKFTSILVPLMCAVYVLAAMAVLWYHREELPNAFSIILSSAFSTSAMYGGVAGGLITVILQGVRRAAFSNEAGVGSAGMAHAAVKTSQPASEGIVALLEPFIDTVIVCTLTSLVIVSTGVWDIKGELHAVSPVYEESSPQQLMETTTHPRLIHEIREEKEGLSLVRFKEVHTDRYFWVDSAQIESRAGWSGGIWITSKAFETVISWFPYVLSIAVLFFAFSTMISWSYYGEQALAFLTGNHPVGTWAYRAIFCVCTVVGASVSLGNVMDLSDALFFTMVFPNLIGIFILLPVIQSELAKFMDHVRKIDRQNPHV